MKAAHIVLVALLAALAACSTAAAPAAPQPLPTTSTAFDAQPARVVAVPTPELDDQPVAFVPTRAAAGTTATRTTLPASSTATTPSQPAPFNIGVPAGDAYYPFSLAIDPARKLAYVYHADSAEKRPVISVVDLAAGKVTRLIRLDRSTPGASGRLFLTPDGKRLLLQENQGYTVSEIDTTTGAVHKVLDGVLDAVLSEDGRVLYALNRNSIAAYSLADLVGDKVAPIWQTQGSFARLASNGARLLASTWGTAGSLFAFDAGTGMQVARGDAPAGADALSAGPDGGWAIIVGGEKPRLIRYDAALKNLGATDIVYTSNLDYDAGRNRYLLGGSRYSESEPLGRPVVLIVNAADGRLAEEKGWPTDTPPSDFVPWGDDRLIGFSAGGPGILHVVDASTLSPQARIATGLRAQDLVIDDEARRLYVADDLGRIHVLDLPGGEEAGLWEGSSPLALDRVNGRLYANRAAGVVALDLRTGGVLATFPQRGNPAPDPRADLVYLANRGVTIYDRTGKQVGTIPSTFPVERGMVPNPYASGAEVNPVTGHVAVIMNNGIPGSNGGSFLRIYARGSDKAVEPSAPHSFVMDLTTDRRGNWYAAYSTARTQDAVQVLSPEGRQLDRLDHRTGYLALEQDKDNLYLFEDGRVTRLVVSTLAPSNLFEGPEYVSTLAFSPSARTAYIVGYSGPLITPVVLDRLTSVDLGPVAGRPPSDAFNDGLAITGQGRERLLVGRFLEVYRTTDGASWQRLLPGLQLSLGHATAVGPRTIFVTGRSPAGGEGVWRSRDGGDTWEWLTEGLPDLQPGGAVLANSADEAYFVDEAQALFRWNAAAGKWQMVSTPDRIGQWGALSLAPDGMLFRSNEGYLERSTEGGKTWTRLGTSNETGDVIGYSSLYTVTHGIFSVVRNGYRITGIQRSTDSGQTWKPSLSGPPLDFDGYQPEVVSGFGNTYLLLRPYQGDPSLLRTTDFGETWQMAPAGTVTGVDHIAVDPVDGRLWLGVKGGVRTLEPDKIKWAEPARARTAVPTPTPTATPAAPPTRTPQPTATVGPCRKALTGRDAEINALGLGLGCPRGPSQGMQMARERFQYGQMIWRQDRKWIYVLYNDGTWEGDGDRWVEGDPADDPNIVPPPGLQQPARGFGKEWREELGGPNARIGWAIEQEQGVQGEAQDWDYGTVLRFGGEVIVLFDRGMWR